MKKDNDKGLDDLFKKKLEAPVDQTGYKEDDWAALEKMLDKHKKKKGIVYWLPYISSVAALLLLFLGWWNFRPHVTRNNPANKPLAVNATRSNTGTNGGSERQPANNIPNKVVPPATYAGSSKSGKSSGMGKLLTTPFANGARHATSSTQAVIRDTTSSESLS